MDTTTGSAQVKAPQVTMPSGGGGLRGIGEPFKAQSFTGSGGFSIPFSVPEARGLAPSVSLSYSSGAGTGLLGLGFSLTFDSIVRKTSTGIPRYDETDVFILGSAGDLVEKYEWADADWVPAASSATIGSQTWDIVAYRPRVEGGFACIEHWTETGGGSHWKVVTADNITHLYGTSDGGRICNPAAPEQVFEWLLESSTDAYGNKIEYTYKTGDRAGVPDTLYNAGRDFSSQRYPWTIRYGNYLAQAGDPATEQFAFEIAFDYGQIDPLHPDAPAGTWAARPDPFSTYKGGFEIRTARRCEGVYLRHLFSGCNNGQPFTTQALLLQYQLAAYTRLSLVSSYIQRGYRPQGNTPLREDMPPVTIRYTDFNPDQAVWNDLELDAPGYFSADGFLPVDLDGLGIDGLLYATDSFTGYLEPLGHGKFAPMRVLDRFPVFRDLASRQAALMALEGNSVLDLVVNEPSAPGFFEHVDRATWQPFQPFQQLPVDFFNSEKAWVDLNGSGKTDLLLFDHPQLRHYPSLGKPGFSDAVYTSKPVLFPATDDGGTESLLGFADFLGDGLSHRFRLRNGSLEVWPNLGHGHFGAPIALAGAPAIDDGLNASRVFLVDADGSGTTDIAYLFPDRVRIWFNQGGNCFSAPIDIPVPAPYTAISALTAGDVTGYGTTSLVFTVTTPEVRHFYFDFSRGLKPYLLQSSANGMGGSDTVAYTTSVLEHLRDRQDGRPWLTRLPMPVHVVSESTTSDDVTGSRYTQRFRYHDGYFDPVVREFRGFGFVETWDTDQYEAFQRSAASDAQRAALLENNQWAPPVYTKSWFLLGTYELTPALLRQYDQEFFKGDAAAWTLPAYELDAAWTNQDARSLQQAHSALAGQSIRTEVYAEDGSVLQQNPYTTSQQSVRVRLIQPRLAGRHCSLQVVGANSLSYAYDRNPEDPLISQDLVLELDAYGAPVLEASIAYPRRTVAGMVLYPEQQQLRCVLASTDHLYQSGTSGGNPAAYWQHLGIAWQHRSYETGGLRLPAAGPFTREDLLQQAQAALAHPATSDTPPDAEPWSRLLSWDRTYYWNDTGTAPLQAGQINALALLHHAETAVASYEQVLAAFGDKVDGALMEERGGYVPHDGYWWNCGLTQYYLWSTAQFFLPWKTENTVAITALQNGADDDSGLAVYTMAQYDAYQLYVEAVISRLSDTVALTTTYAYDYMVPAPWRSADPNGNIAEQQYSPLGNVIMTTVYGTVAGRPTGDLPAAEYNLPNAPTFNDVIAAPAQYLQGATTYFYYDLFAWSSATNPQPVSSVTVTRNLHVQELEAEGKGADDTLFPVSIAFSDGLGRTLQTKVKTTPGDVTLRAAYGTVVNPGDDGTAERWLVSGRTVYDNKGQPVAQYEPYFSATPHFEDQQALIDEDLVPPPTLLRYDPVGRVVRTDSPKGFFAKTDYTPWQVTSYDYNDTLLDSRYYQEFLASYPLAPAPWQVAELEAIQAALPCYHTPATVVQDNLGHTIRTIACNLGGITAETIPAAVAAPQTPQEAWNGLIAAGYLTAAGNVRTAWVTPAFQPYQPGFHATFLERFPDNGVQLEDFLAQSCLTSLGVYNIQGQQLSSTDPRLFLKMVREETVLFNFRTAYNLAGDALQTESADAGTTWNLSSMLGSLIYSWDSRGFTTQHCYDTLQRPCSVWVSGGDGPTPLSNLVQQTIYGETAPDAAAYNLVGQAWKGYDESGLTIIDAYGLGGQMLQGTTYLRADYKNAANWTPDAQEAVLTEPAYPRSFRYNAAGQLLETAFPDGSRQTNAYDINGQLRTSAQQLAGTTGAASWVTAIAAIAYDATGRRTHIHYGNGVSSTYTYDAMTQQLVQARTTRPAAGSGTELLHDLYYTYDPVGHTIAILDSAQETVYSGNQAVAPRNTYAYDPLYRLIRATGRTLPGLSQPGTPGSTVPVAPVTDLQNLEAYTQRYGYDFGDNLVQKRHTAASGSWTQTQLVAATSNRLVAQYAGNPADRPDDGPQFRYDAGGNLLNLVPGSTAVVAWNYLDHIGSVTTIARQVVDPATGAAHVLNDAEYYQYDQTGSRVRKVTERMLENGTQVAVTEKVYLGDYQCTRTWVQPASGSGTAPAIRSERHTLLLQDGDAPALITHTWIVPPPNQSRVAAGDTQYRYQLCDPLDSVTIELTDTAALLTFEQYYPYGGTAFTIAGDQLDAASKERRFCGKERDAVTGMYYYGARYYAEWLGRWMSPDPAGAVDGPNLYLYASNNPVTYNDPTGLMPVTRSQGKTPAASTARKKIVNKTTASSQVPTRNTPAAALKAPLFDKSRVFKRPYRSATGLFRQSQLSGASSGGRKTYYPTKQSPMTPTQRGRYLHGTRSVLALLKVNGVELQMGENGRAGNNLHFHMGSENQKGKKINPHAEDWNLSSFRNAYEQAKKNDKNTTMESFLTSKGASITSNTGKNTAGKHVFSLRINYSPCLGCVETILGFKEFVEKELGDGAVLRVKFLRPYALPKTLKSNSSDAAQNFEEAVGTMQKAGVFVKLQNTASAKKWDKSITGTGDAFGTEVINRITPTLYGSISQSWTNMGINRKK